MKLNSCTGTEAAIQRSEPESLGAFADAAKNCGPETILLVEDEAFVRKATAEALESAGYRLIIAESATAAFEAYRKCLRPVDLLLADVAMPGMSGRELAVEFANACPSARILLMSGHDEQLAGCEPSRYARGFLGKPFSIRTLLSTVREELDRNRSTECVLSPH